jgi:hypothetical protein
MVGTPTPKVESVAVGLPECNQFVCCFRGEQSRLCTQLEGFAVVSDFVRLDSPSIDGVELDAALDAGERPLDDERMMPVEVPKRTDAVEDTTGLSQLDEGILGNVQPRFDGSTLAERTHDVTQFLTAGVALRHRSGPPVVHPEPRP